MPASPIGTLMRKIQCQVKKVVMKPPSGGPMIGPISAGMVSHAMADTSSLRGTARTRTRRATGVIIAPPMPCKKRDRTNAISDPETAQSIEPATKTRIAMRNTRFAPNLSAIQPLTGMKIASATRYAVRASFSAIGLVPISAAMAGSEVAITVESICSIRSATARMRGIDRFKDGSRACVQAGDWRQRLI